MKIRQKTEEQILGTVEIIVGIAAIAGGLYRLPLVLFMPGWQALFVLALPPVGVTALVLGIVKLTRLSRPHT